MFSFYYPYKVFDEEFRTRCNGFGRLQATNTQFRPEGRRHEVPPPKKKQCPECGVLEEEVIKHLEVMSSYTHHLGTSFFGQVLFKQKKEPGVFMLVGSAFSSSRIRHFQAPRSLEQNIDWD